MILIDTGPFVALFDPQGDRFSNTPLRLLSLKTDLTHQPVGNRTNSPKFSNIANANSQNIATDAHSRMLAATGYRAEQRVKKSRA